MSQATNTLTDEDIRAGQKPRVGDTVILTDFANCYPHSAIKTESVKGKWWLRSYRTESGAAGQMLCVEERDMDDPESCLAPPLTYHPNLEGTYDIWVGTYRDIAYGGIDIKLSNDPVYQPIMPYDDGIPEWPLPEEQIGRLAECFYKTVELTGQDIQLRQPHGTYNSFWWGMCNAHVAYIKLVRRSSEDVEREAAAKAQLERKGVVIDRDGFSYVWEWGEENLDCILQQVEVLRYGGCDVLNWCIGSSLNTNFPHPMTTGRITGGGRLGDVRAARVFKYFEDNGIDVLQVLVDRCHEVGLKIFVSHRANSPARTNNIWEEHPEWWGEHQPGARLNYANPELQTFLQKFLLYIPEHYDVDGLTIDFTRHPPFFNDGQENQFELMTNYLRGLRTGLDRIGEEKGKHLDLYVSFECGAWRGFTAESCGLDVPTWVDENIVDCIMPQGREVPKYIEMCRGKRALCYPRRGAGQGFDGSIIDIEHTFDPTPADDKQDRYWEVEYAPLQILAGCLDWYEAGADGVFLFNQLAYTPLRHLPYPDLIRREITSGQPFGRRVGEKVEWTE